MQLLARFDECGGAGPRVAAALRRRQGERPPALPSCAGAAILLIAPSDAAADLLLAALDETYRTLLPALGLAPFGVPAVGGGGGRRRGGGSQQRPAPLPAILRLNDPSRPLAAVRPSLLAYCALSRTGRFVVPAAAAARHCRLIVCAATAAALLPALVGGSCPPRTYLLLLNYNDLTSHSSRPHLYDPRSLPVST